MGAAWVREKNGLAGSVSGSWTKGNVRQVPGDNMDHRRRHDVAVQAVNDTHNRDADKIVYWHRELPPLDAELMSEHTLEATSSRVPGTISHRDELWDRCYTELMAIAEARLAQEIARFGGHFAHVHDESIDTRRDDAAGEAWLRGTFSYMLYRRPSKSPPP
jgi:hypothetical protein